MLQVIKLRQKGSLIIRGTGAGLEVERWKLPGSAIKGLSSPPADKFHLNRLHLAPSLELVVWGFWPSFLLCENWTCQHKPALVLWDFGAPQETDIFSTSFSVWKASTHHKNSQTLKRLQRGATDVWLSPFLMKPMVASDSPKHTGVFRLLFNYGWPPPSFSSTKTKGWDRRRRRKQGVGLIMGVRICQKKVFSLRRKDIRARTIYGNHLFFTCEA